MGNHISFRDLKEFHGHACPKLALAYRMAIAALDHLGCSRSAEEELLAVVEQRDCGVDAVQLVTGCTVGKGNLIIHDNHQPELMLLETHTGRAVTISPSKWTEDHMSEWASEQKRWDDTIKTILKYPESQLMKILEGSLGPEDINVVISG